MMTAAAYNAVRDALKVDEAFMPVVYDDATGSPIHPGYQVQGIPTIGYGTNLLEGISSGVALLALDEKLQQRIGELYKAHPVVLTLDDVRQGVLANMAYNMGVPRLNGFVQMWKAIESQPPDFDAAADAMLDSKWAQQVKARAARLGIEMRTGVAS